MEDGQASGLLQVSFTPCADFASVGWLDPGLADETEPKD